MIRLFGLSHDEFGSCNKLYKLERAGYTPGAVHPSSHTCIFVSRSGHVQKNAGHDDLGGICVGSCSYSKKIGFDHLHFHHVFNLDLHEVPSSQSPPCSQTKCVDMINCNDRCCGDRFSNPPICGMILIIREELVFRELHNKFYKLKYRVYSWISCR